MAIQYVAGRQNIVFNSPLGTKQELINEIETVCDAAGWTTVSGSGTTNLLLQSATTPDGLKMRLRVKDNAGSCVTLSLENVGGSVVCGNSTTVGIFLLPAAGKNWHLIINKYQGFIFTPAPSAAREFAAFGVPSLPANLSGVVLEAMWLHGNGQSDASAAAGYSFRIVLMLSNTANASGTAQDILNGVKNDRASSGSSASSQALQAVGNWNQANTNLPIAYRWQDGSAFLYDAIICWSNAGTNTDARGIGQLWDAALSSESYPGDATASFDTHSWIVITDTNNGSSSNGIFNRGTLLLVTS